MKKKNKRKKIIMIGRMMIITKTTIDSEELQLPRIILIATFYDTVNAAFRCR